MILVSAAIAGAPTDRPEENPTVPYVDGFALAVPKRKLPAYKRMATKAEKIDIKRMAYGGFKVLVDM